MFVVGLTGGIGAGKSAVSERFAKLGVPVIDTDDIARSLTRPGGEAVSAIRKQFGDGVMRGADEIDRTALRRLVFEDPAARVKLESILHPRIRREVERALAVPDAPYALLVVPLLLETGAYADIVQRVLVVECPEQLRIARVMARSKLTRAEVEAIMAAQVSDATRRASADDTLDNAGAITLLDAAVADLHRRYMQQAQTATGL